MDKHYGKFRLIYLFICFTSQINGSYCRKSAEFVIKNVHCGKFIHSKAHGVPQSLDPLILWDGPGNSYDRFTFEPVDGIWGYIQNTASGGYWHPKGGYSYSRKEGTHLVLWGTKERWAQFAIDQVNNHIIHRDGQFVEYDDGYNPYPPNGDNIELTHSVHDGIAWVFLNPKNLSETVYPYGGPKIVGEWELVYAVINPLATQTWEYTYTIGKSASKSTSRTLDYHEGFEFTWESSFSASASGDFKFFGKGISAEASSSTSLGTSTSSSLSEQISSASEDTWFGETTVTASVTVPAGKSVVIWQRVFIGSQLGHKAVFQSNIFEYTDSLDVKP